MCDSCETVCKTTWTSRASLKSLALHSWKDIKISWCKIGRLQQILKYWCATRTQVLATYILKCSMQKSFHKWVSTLVGLFVVCSTFRDKPTVHKVLSIKNQLPTSHSLVSNPARIFCNNCYCLLWGFHRKHKVTSSVMIVQKETWWLSGYLLCWGLITHFCGH